MSVAIIGAPREFAETLGALPEGASLRSGMRVRPGMVIWFMRSAGEPGREIRRITGFAGGAPLWIAWRKKSHMTGIEPTGPSENEVRDAGLSAGLVDYKVCAIDATWSGLLFVPRRNTSVT